MYVVCVCVCVISSQQQWVSEIAGVTLLESNICIFLMLIPWRDYEQLGATPETTRVLTPSYARNILLPVAVIQLHN